LTQAPVPFPEAAPAVRIHSSSANESLALGILRSNHRNSPLCYYVVDAWRGRVEFAALKRKAIELYERRHQPSLRSPSL